jgi:hypothetical protein
VSQMDASMARVWCERDWMEMRREMGRRRRQRFFTPIFLWMVMERQLCGSPLAVGERMILNLTGRYF